MHSQPMALCKVYRGEWSRSEVVLTDPVAHSGHEVKIGVKHAGHEVSVTGKHEHEVFVLGHVDELDKHLNNLGAVISGVLLVEAIGLIDEEDSSERAGDHLSRLGSSVSDVLTDKIGSSGLHGVSGVNEPHFLVQLAHLHRDSGLA